MSSLTLLQGKVFVVMHLPVSLPDVARLESTRFPQPGDLRAKSRQAELLGASVVGLQLRGDKILSLGPAAEHHNFGTSNAGADK